MKHLLWGCMLMKTYTTGTVLARLAGVCRETFSKWAWLAIKMVSNLHLRVVSAATPLLAFLV